MLSDDKDVTLNLKGGGSSALMSGGEELSLGPVHTTLAQGLRVTQDLSTQGPIPTPTPRMQAGQHKGRVHAGLCGGGLVRRFPRGHSSASGTRGILSR